MSSHFSSSSRDYRKSSLSSSFGQNSRSYDRDVRREYDRDIRRPYQNRQKDQQQKPKPYVNPKWKKQQQPQPQQHQQKSNITSGIVYRTSDADLKKVFKPTNGHWETTDLKEFEKLAKNLREAFPTQNTVEKEEECEKEPLGSNKEEDKDLKETEAKNQKLAGIRQILQYQVGKLPEPVEDAIRVSIKFPCGSNLIRRFCSTDSLEVLFNIVFAHQKCPEDFSLLSSYPRKELPCAPDWYKEYGTVAERTGGIQSFKEAGLDSSVGVIVKDNRAQ
uniref:UBX domain-containing protein n=1 Tax=Panagrolaimus superbus TaxID=310955 RepID=A0A914XU26_9BILA